jgi:hypothetical protein
VQRGAVGADGNAGVDVTLTQTSLPFVSFAIKKDLSCSVSSFGDNLEVVEPASISNENITAVVALSISPTADDTLLLDYGVTLPAPSTEDEAEAIPTVKSVKVFEESR